MTTIMPAVEVIWDDAFSSSSDMTMKKAQKNIPIRTHTIGYLMADNDEGVTVCADTYPKDTKTGAHINFIPHCMIVEYWVWK